MNINDRWEQAQKKERIYHKKHFIKIEDREKYRTDLNHFFLKKYFDLDLKFFEEKRVLEVGCGTRGVIYYLDEAKYRIGIEPMNLDGMIEDWKKQFVKYGIGEQIPFENNSFDIVLAINILDHVIDPKKVIRECYRVLKKGGKLILSVHVLSPKATIFRPFLNRFDAPHPHHFTEKEFLNLFSVFNIICRSEQKGIDDSKFFNLLSNFKIKLILGNLLLSQICLVMKK